MCASFCRATARFPARSGASMRLTASSNPRVAKVVEAKAAVAMKENQNGSKLKSATAAHAAAPESPTSNIDSAMPARKSPRGLPLRSSRSPLEITLPINTTG